jgi:hypothetical protein
VQPVTARHCLATRESTTALLQALYVRLALATRPCTLVVLISPQELVSRSLARLTVPTATDVQMHLSPHLCFAWTLATSFSEVAS